MICKSCGNEIRDDAKFCPHCGAVSGEAPSYAAPEAPVPGAGSGKKRLILGGVAAVVVAVIAIVAVFAGGLFSNPKKQVERAMAKSAAAYAAAGEQLGLPDVRQWRRDRSVFQGIGLSLNNINSDLAGLDLSALSGLEISAAAGYSGEDQYMLAEAAACWGLDELFLFRMVADDAELYFHSPQFTGDAYYGVNTETLGADLTRMTGDDSMDSVSFNLFDLVDKALEQMDPEGMKQDLKEATKVLWEEAQVKKTGSKTMVVSKVNTKANVYQVTIPEEALDRYVDDLETALSALDYYELYEEMFQTMGIPREEIQDFLDQLESVDLYGELTDGLRQLADEIGDLTLNVFLSGGYVSSVQYEGYLFDDDTFVKISVFLGGGEEYVDDLHLELKVDDQLITVDSTGDHGLKSGVFSDETVIKGPFPRINSEVTLDPSKQSDNFQWELGVESSGLSLFTLETQGGLYVKEDIIDLTLENAACKVMGMEVCGLRFNYRICRFPDWVIQPMENAKLVTQMDQMELMTAMLDIQSRVETWAVDMETLFASRLPRELFWVLKGNDVYY